MVALLSHLAETSFDYSTSATAGSGTDILGGMIGLLIGLPLLVLALVGMWKVFTKAGYAGWKSLIPIYNAVLLFKMAGLNPWLLLLYLLSAIPFVGFVVSIGLSVYLGINLAKAFGKSAVFGVVALAIFSFVGFLMLGFGDAKYVGPARGNDLPSDGSSPMPGAPTAPASTPPTPPPTAPTV